MKPQTLSEVAVVAVEASLEIDRVASPLDKFKHDQLARKIYENAHAVLSPEDIATIKDRIGKAWGAVQIGASWPLLDPTLDGR